MPPSGAVITPLNVSYIMGNHAGVGDVSRVPGAAAVFMGPNGDLFSPGYPLAPMQPAELRSWDFQVGRNQIYRPRAYEPIQFDQLFALAENHDITSLAIETRKDQIEKLDWSIRPRDGFEQAGGIDKRVQAATDFFLHPDADHDKPDNDFATWLRKLLHQCLVIDAPALEVRRARDGEVIGFDVIDGATISVLIDSTGRRPKPPLPAFTQIIHGRPWKLLTEWQQTPEQFRVARDLGYGEIIYRPRNPRMHKLYGFSPVEQIVNTVNVALRRQTQQLSWYSDTNVPAGMLNAPEGWNADQIRQFQDWFDSTLASQAERSKLIWAPHGSGYQAFKDPPIKDAQDEWFARVVCYAFSLSPTPFVTQVNRTTAESAQEAALAEGLGPLMGWVQRLVGFLLRVLGYDDLEFTWSNEKPLSPADQKDILVAYVGAGIYKVNEARDALGLEQDPAGDVLISGQGSNAVLLSAIVNPPEPPPIPEPPAATGQPIEPGVGNEGEDQGEAEAPASPPPPESKDQEAGKSAAAPFGKARRGRKLPAPEVDETGLARAERSLKRKLSVFFTEQAASVAKQVWPKVSAVTRAAEDDGPQRRVDRIIAGLSFDDWDVLIDPTAEDLAPIYRDGTLAALRVVGFEDGTSTTNQARSRLGLPPISGGDEIPAIVRQVNQRSVDWAKDRSAELVTQISENTRGMLRTTITGAIEEGWSAAKLAGEIAKSPAFGDDRAELIARTETVNSNNAGNLAAYKSSGVVQKKAWLPASDACDICLTNADAGDIELDALFPGGVDSPSQHPACRCSVIPVVEDDQ